MPWAYMEFLHVGCGNSSFAYITPLHPDFDAGALYAHPAVLPMNPSISRESTWLVHPRSKESCPTLQSASDPLPELAPLPTDEPPLHSSLTFPFPPLMALS